MISYFVSSTFRDIHHERDVISTHVLPLLREVAQERGEDVDLIDLRWGIDTSELERDDSVQRILEICMQSIDAAIPHLIILLGSRYGSCPDGEALARFLESPQGKELRGEDVGGKSITELEVMHAQRRLRVLGVEDLARHVTVCIRDLSFGDDPLPEEVSSYLPQSRDEARQSARLREMLARRYPQSVLRYQLSWNADKGCWDGLEAFG